MDLILLALAGVLVVLGVLGSFLPVLPGIPLSWCGLLLLHLSVVPLSYTFLGVTLFATIIIFILQYVIPALGTKYLGGTRRGMIGATLGLIVGIFIPIPFSIIITAFVGAYIGEILNKADSKTALKAAWGSFLGLMASTVMELGATLIFLFLFVYKLWEYRSLLPWF